MGSLFTLIVFGSLWGVACGVIATNKNRSGLAWGAWGFFFGIIALIVVLCKPRLDSADATMLGMGTYAMGPRPNQ